MNPAQWLMKGLIRGYQWLVSPFLPGTCRFIPTCSEYAAEAVQHHGALKGGFIALKRILRCHPWAAWGYDPVPGTEGAHQHAPSCGCGEHTPAAKS